jgi:hypothetical protein
VSFVTNIALIPSMFLMTESEIVFALVFRREGLLLEPGFTVNGEWLGNVFVTN